MAASDNPNELQMIFRGVRKGSSAMGAEFAVGSFTSFPYFQAIDTDINNAFVERYRDRILFGTDIVDDTPWSTLSAVEVAEKAPRTRERIGQELTWYERDGDVTIRDRQTPGLGLPADVLPFAVNAPWTHNAFSRGSLRVDRGSGSSRRVRQR